MAFKFPFTNYHELNLTWVLEQLKKLFEDSEENVETIESYENRLSAVETELPTVEATAEQAETVANAAASLAQTAKATADTANENALTASAQAGLARQEAATAGTEAQAATQAAQQAQATAQNFDGRITQAEADASEALQEAQSFENRVNAAINTANNAANTATIAQGIAVNANQNAATALDTAQTADGKAEAAQDAADIADGKAEAAQDTADLADEKADTNAANIGNLADLTTTAKNNLVAAINEAAQSGGSGDNTNCAPIIINTASGDVAVFTDGANNRQIRQIVGTIEPIQSGSGTPSPTNVRQISGHTGVNIYHEITYDALATPKLSINWQTEAGIIYKGTITLNNDGSVDVVSAWTMKEFDGSSDENWTFSTSNRAYIVVTPYPLYVRTEDDHILCNRLRPVRASASTNDNVAFVYGTNTIGFRTDSTLTSDNIREWLQNNPLQMCYELVTPIPYHFPDVGTMLTYYGINNVWIDTGAITDCNYPADTKLYIDNKIAELQALVLEN